MSIELMHPLLEIAFFAVLSMALEIVLLAHREKS